VKPATTYIEAVVRRPKPAPEMEKKDEAAVKMQSKEGAAMDLEASLTPYLDPSITHPT